MPTTPSQGLPYPAGTDGNDVPADMQALADAVDAKLDAVDALTAASNAHITQYNNQDMWEATSGNFGVSGSTVDVASLTFTAVSGRLYEYMVGATCELTTTPSTTTGSTAFIVANSSNTIIRQARHALEDHSTNNVRRYTHSFFESGLSGSVTRKFRYWTNSGYRINATSGERAFFLVRDVGPA